MDACETLLEEIERLPTGVSLSLEISALTRLASQPYPTVAAHWDSFEHALGRLNILHASAVDEVTPRDLPKLSTFASWVMNIGTLAGKNLSREAIIFTVDKIDWSEDDLKRLDDLVDLFGEMRLAPTIMETSMMLSFIERLQRFKPHIIFRHWTEFMARIHDLHASLSDTYYDKTAENFETFFTFYAWLQKLGNLAGIDLSRKAYFFGSEPLALDADTVQEYQDIRVLEEDLTRSIGKVDALAEQAFMRRFVSLSSHTILHHWNRSAQICKLICFAHAQRTSVDFSRDATEFIAWAKKMSTCAGADISNDLAVFLPREPKSEKSGSVFSKLFRSAPRDGG